MAQTIDPVKLKAAAEHLEWVLQQYPDNDDVQSLLCALTPLIEGAKAGSVRAPLDRIKIPGAYNFGDGRFVAYANPNVGDAYSAFITEMEGGLTDEDKQILAHLRAFRAGVQTHE